jgi:hypothetical protein
MNRIVKIEGVGSVVFPDSMSDAEVSQVASRLYDDANPAGSTATGVANSDTSGWRRIQTSDKKHYMIHPEDLQEALKRDPSLIIHDQQ